MPGIKLAELAQGAVEERFQTELQKVLDNILDPNTDPTKARKLTLTLTFKPGEDRDLAIVLVDAKTALVPPVGIATKILMDRDHSGKAVGAELKQVRLFDDEPQGPREVGNVSYLSK